MAYGMTTDDTQPTAPPFLKKILAANPVPDAGPAPMLSTMPAMGGPIPRLSAPDAPQATLTPTSRDLLRDNTSTDAGELNRLKTSGSGIDQIQNTPLRVAAHVGEGILTSLFPRIAAITPGTTANHNRLIGQEQGRVASDLGDENKQASTTLLDAQPELKQAALDNRSLQIQNQQQYHEGQLDVAKEKAEGVLRGQGYKHDAQGNTVPLDYDEMSVQQQGAVDAKKAQSDYKNAQADYIKAKSDPNSFEGQQAVARMNHAKALEGIAYQKILQQGQGLAMRRENMDANLYGVGANGQTLANAPQFVGDDGTVTTGGLRGANTAIKQQGAVGQFRDLGGSIQRMGSQLEDLHNSGSSLSDVRVVDALNDASAHGGTLSTVMHSKLVKAGMTPQQVNAVAGLASFQEQLGTLRAAAKGSSSEAQTERMIHAAPTAGDTPEIARRKMVELQATYDRLAPSVSTIGGGMSLNGKGGRLGSGNQGGTVNMRAPTGEIVPVAADQVEHYKGRGAVVVP